MIVETKEKRAFLHWLKESVTVKLAFIGFLTLVLLIPSALIENLVNERAARQEEVTQDVSDKWSGSQLLRGPVLSLPYKILSEEKDDNGKKITKENVYNMHVLPNDLSIKAELKTEKLHRGIYEVVVYNTIIRVSGNFAPVDLNAVGLTADMTIPQKAHVSFSISDLKGLKTNPVVNIGGQPVPAQPIFDSQLPFTTGLQASIDLTAFKGGQIPFNFTLDLKGSQQISFLHLGKTTTVEASGNWAAPSFDGRYLPEIRNVDAKGFSAKWRMLYYNRPYPQQWLGNDTLLTNEKKEADASFGIRLRVPVDEYQKTTRTSKYSLLIIILTFISLFLTEVVRKQKIHPFNYLLIGAAMVIYYTLLLSFSEQIGYNWAYLVASIATVSLITTFIGSLIKNRNAALLFAFILSVIYTFIFVIIQLEDYALIMGSVALFVIVGMLMYFTRKINWDKQ